MEVTLTEEQQALVRMRVESGKNATAQEVVDDALGLLLEDEILASADQEELKAALRRARAQLDRGEGIVLKNRGDLVREIVEESRRRAEQRGHCLDFVHWQV